MRRVIGASATEIVVVAMHSPANSSDGEMKQNEEEIFAKNRRQQLQDVIIFIYVVRP